MNTTSSDFDCSPLEQYQRANVIRSLRCTTRDEAPPSTNRPSSSGLSFDKKVGIGAGVGGAVVLGIILGLLFCCAGRRRRRAQRKDLGPSNADNLQEVVAHDRDNPPLYESVAQMSKGGMVRESRVGGKEGMEERSSGVNELEAPHEVFELQANREFAELMGDHAR